MHAGATVLELGPLGEDDVLTFVRELGQLSDESGTAKRFAHRLHGAAAGNPFYLMELLRTMLIDGWLRPSAESGEWSGSPGWSETLPLPACPPLHAVTAQRLDALSDELREILVTLAVAEGPSSAALLSHVHGISRLRAASDADALVNRHLAVEADGSYQCAHPIVAQVVRGELTTARRHEAQRAIRLARELLAESELGSPDATSRHPDGGGRVLTTYQ